MKEKNYINSLIATLFLHSFILFFLKWASWIESVKQEISSNWSVRVVISIKESKNIPNIDIKWCESWEREKCSFLKYIFNWIDGFLVSGGKYFGPVKVFYILTIKLQTAKAFGESTEVEIFIFSFYSEKYQHFWAQHSEEHSC